MPTTTQVSLQSESQKKGAGTSTQEYVDKTIDLYSILDIDSAADTEQIRRRVNTLFLEAQSNLDHRNFRRRFYYQELFEIHLPQARQYLLDPQQRRLYDQALNGGGVVELPSPAETQLDLDRLPSVYAAPPTSEVQNPNSTTASPASSTRTQRTAAPVFHSTPDSSGRVASSHTTQHTNQHTTQQALDYSTEAGRLERRRDYKRRELIKNELIDVGYKWGITIAFLTVFACFLLLRFINEFWLNTTSNRAQWINLSGLVFSLMVAYFCGRYAHREARRRTIVLLSQMPYKALLRRCARL